MFLPRRLFSHSISVMPTYGAGFAVADHANKSDGMAMILNSLSLALQVVREPRKSLLKVMTFGRKDLSVAQRFVHLLQYRKIRVTLARIVKDFPMVMSPANFRPIIRHAHQPRPGRPKPPPFSGRNPPAQRRPFAALADDLQFSAPDIFPHPAVQREFGGNINGPHGDTPLGSGKNKNRRYYKCNSPLSARFSRIFCKFPRSRYNFVS